MYKSIFLLFLSSAFSLISVADDNKQYTKEFEKSFSVDPGAIFDVDLDFSTLIIENWDKNEVHIHGEVTVESNDENRANKIFDKIAVDMYGNSDEVGLSTEIGENLSSGRNESFEIIFTIKMPRSMGLSGRVDFGDVELPVIEGPVIFKVGYGTLHAQGLNNSENEVTSEFGEMEIETFGGGMLKVSFGDLDVGRISKDLELHCSYSDVNIDMVEASCKSLKVENAFGDVDMTISENAAFDIVVSVSFGDVELPSAARNINKDNGFTSKSITAEIGNPSSTGDMKVNCEFGDVNINQ